MSNENPYPKDSTLWAAMEFRLAVLRLGRESARALGIYWLLDKIAARMK